MPETIPSVVQLKRAIKITAQIRKLETELATLLGETPAGTRDIINQVRAGAAKAFGPRKTRKPYVLSPEARVRIAEAQKARWARAGGRVEEN